MKLCIKFIMFFAVIALLVGATTEIVHFDKQQQCSCCKSKCPQENNCHAEGSDCLCAGKIPIQAGLVQSGSLPESTVVMSCLQKTSLLYSFRLARDIFHPPKV